MSNIGFANPALCAPPRMAAVLKSPVDKKMGVRLWAWKSAAVVRGEQAACLLLATVPLAERMLLYHAATTAWLMLPERGQLEKCFVSCYGRFSRQGKCARA